MSTQIDDIVSDIPLDQLAAQLGTDPETAESAVRQALPALLGGMQANAADPAGAASLSSAVEQHSSQLIDGGVNLDDVNTEDGEKIVSHVFGESSGDVAHTLGGNLGLGQGSGNDLIGRLLPILAPIVLSYLAKRFMGGGAQQAGAQSGGGIGDILGSVLGSAGGQSAQAQSGGGGILDMLGGLLGGGRR